MVGGSAIALYLNHRLSEDVDLFTFTKDIEWNNIVRELKSIYPETKVKRRFQNQLDLLVNETKVTFRKETWDVAENALQSLNYIKLANIGILTMMKVNTIFMRAKFRDYYDLYVINKEVFTIDEIFEISSKYIKGINKKWFQQAIFFTDDIEDENIEYLKPKYNITKQEISRYFENEIKKWNKRL